MKELCVICILVCNWLTTAICQSIPLYRTTDWTRAGYPGNIPVYSLQKNILDFGGNPNGVITNDSALANAVAALNNEKGIIYFPAGNYLFTAPAIVGSGILLRGEGAGNTTLSFDLGGSYSLLNIRGALSDTETALLDPAFRNQTSLTVQNPSIFQQGDRIKLYDNDASLLHDDWAFHSTGQILKIDSIINHTIYFTNPLRRNYILAQQPAVRKLQMVSGTGIECLKIVRRDSSASQTANIVFLNAVDCWVSGVESDSCNFAHVQLSSSANITISNSFFHNAFDYGAGGKAYGVSCENGSGDCLVENNIFRRLRHSMLVQSGANGNVFAYNYSLQPYKTDTLPNDFSGDVVLHGNYPYLNLFEGNMVQNIIADASHGKNGPHNTFLRNRAELYGIIISPGAGDSSNIVGNEITGNGFQQGNYILFGAGNLQYGNNKNSTIFPPGTILPPEKSLRYTQVPSFWNIPYVWPSIGISNNMGTGSIPAKERLNTAAAYCMAYLPQSFIFTGNGNWTDTANWSNYKVPGSFLAAGTEISIDPAEGGKCVLNIPYTISSGVTLTVKPYKKMEVNNNLFFVY